MHRVRLLVNTALFIGITFSLVHAIESEEETKQNTQYPYALWLGRQTNAGPFIDAEGKLHFKDVVQSKGYLVGRVWEKVKDNISIDLRVVAGSKVRLPDTLNGYVTLINGEVGCVYMQTAWQKKNAPNWDYGDSEPTQEVRKLLLSSPRPTNLPLSKESLYVVGIVKQKEVRKAYYSLNVQVDSGPLAGAIVHLRDDCHPESRKDPFVAIYKIPDHLEVNEGILEWRLVRIAGK